MIPKIIHYCWFGKGEMPESAKKCINSWKKMCPQYKIIRWDESNFNVNECLYIRQAYEEKKWAFVSDYARFKIIYEYGGIYLDTDVELVKNLDNLISKGPYFGEEIGLEMLVNPGLGMASEAKNELYAKILDYYSKQSFIKKDGAINSETVVSRVSNILKERGFKGSGEIEKISGFYIYPPEYFCPKNYYTGELIITEKTYSIHHYSATWHEPEEEKSYLIEMKLNRMFGLKIGSKIGKPVHYFYRFKFRVRENKGIIRTIIFYFKKMFKR